MSKRHRKISLILIGFLLTLSTILSFAEPPEAPNQLITENPYKEVKTVEANKNREHAEMNISVDKLNLKNLDAYKISDTEYYIELPAEENLKENETYYVSKSIEDLPDIYSVNGKKTITNLNRFKDYSIETADFSYGFTDNFILIDRAPIGTKSFIVSKLDKSSGEIKKVYEVDRFKAADISELEGETINENSQIAFKLTDEMMNIFSENQREIKVVKTLKDILNKGNRVKRSLDKNILSYELNMENKELVVDNSNSVEELKIVVLNGGRVEKIYTGKRVKREYHIGKIRVDLDSRILSVAKNTPFKQLLGGTYLTNNLSNWLNNKTSKVNCYSEMTKVTSNLNPSVTISSYTTYEGRNILLEEDGKQIFSNRKNNGKGLALPVGKLSRDKMLDGFSVNLVDFSKGERENAIFTYKGTDNKTYSGEIEISMDNQRELSGSGLIDITDADPNLVLTFPKAEKASSVSSEQVKIIKLKNITGDFPDITGLSGKSILTTIVFNVKSSTENFEKVEGDLSGETFPSEIILNDNRLPFKIGLTKDGKLKVIKLQDGGNYSYTIEMTYRYKAAILGKFKVTIKNVVSEGKLTLSFDSNNFAMIQGYNGNNYYGWAVIYPDSDPDFGPSTANIKYLRAYNTSMTGKNGQTKQAKIEGKIAPARGRDAFGNFKFTVGSKKSEPMPGHRNYQNMLHYKLFDAEGLVIGLDYDRPVGLDDSISVDGGLNLAFISWDLEEKDIDIKIENTTFINTLKIKIPEFNGEVYYNKNVSQPSFTEVDYMTKTLRANLGKETSGEMEVKFNVATKDYDLKILGRTYKNNYNLYLKIPRQINLDIVDEYGTKQTIPFSVNVKSESKWIYELGNYFYIYPPYDGHEGYSSEIKATVILKAMLRQSFDSFKRSISTNHITGKNLNLVSIGAKSTKGIEKCSTIIDKVDLKMELKNFSETINVSDISISEKVYSKNGYYGLIQNENKLILKDGNKKIFETTFEELTKTKQEILDAEVSIKYNLVGTNKNQFEFEKIKAVNYNKTLRLEIYTSSELLLYYIDFNIINKAGIEIEGDGILNFGSFFPGDIKKSEALIKLKNPSSAKIDVSLNPSNIQKMFKAGVKITPNTTIPLSNIQISDLKTESSKINSFRISGEAKTTTTTEVGEYKGELDVIITVIP